jgi:hypothetical protein
VKLIYEPAVRLLTGNGPQTIDAQAREIRSSVSTRATLSHRAATPDPARSRSTKPIDGSERARQLPNRALEELDYSVG